MSADRITAPTRIGSISYDTGNDVADAHKAAPDDTPKDAPESDLDIFAGELFGHVAPEDLGGYKPIDLAALAVDAFAFLYQRTRGAPKIRIVQPAANA